MKKEQSTETKIPRAKTKAATFFFLFLLIIGSVGIDQLSKSIAEKNFMVWSNSKDTSLYQGRRQHLLTIGNSKATNQGYYLSFAFNYVRNKGAAWGAFSNLKESIRKPFFHLVTILATIIILLYWYSIPVHHHLARFAIALVFSGALGNFTDRFRRGFVVDFLDVSWSLPLPFLEKPWVYEFPKFNWADSCITMGVFLLIIDLMFINGDSSENKNPFGLFSKTKDKV